MAITSWEIQVRPATIDDSAEIARLLTQLGHPTSADSVAQKWEDWSAAQNGAFVVDRNPQGIAGVVTIHQMTVLHRMRPVGRITALIVDVDSQKRGIGRALVKHAEQHLAKLGCGILEITSNHRLVEAHRFYERLGYQKTSVRLAKTLMESSQ